MTNTKSANRRALLVAPLAALMLLSACRSGPADIEVTRFHMGQPVTRGSIVVEANDPALATTVEFRTFQAVVIEELARIGFGAPVGGASSEFVATMAYTQTTQSSRAAPANSGTAAPSTGAAVAVPVGRRDNLVAVNTLSMQIKRRANMTPIWEGRASVTETAGTDAASMSATIRPLSAALLKDFPGTSGMTVRVPQ
jgi:hypothetical protein